MKMTRKLVRAQRRELQSAQKRGRLKHVAQTSIVTAALMFSVLTGTGFALPQNGQVVGGAGNVAQTGATMTVTQTTQNMAVNWQSFNIAANESVRFIQPSAQAIALNRVIGADPSSIYGHLSANGRLFLINPNGVLFGAGSRVDVGGIVASTLNISDKDFMAGNYRFSQTGSPGSVANFGAITAAPGGYIVLAATQATNAGTMTATGGTAAVVAGGQMVLDLPGDGKISLNVTQAAPGAVATNAGTILTPSGQAILAGRSADAILTSVVNNTGVIEARSISNQNGVIVLDGGATGVTQTGGAIVATGTGVGQTGGTVRILGDKVAVTGTVDASGTTGGGTILVGGAYQGKGPEANATATYIGKDAQLKADAIGTGDGGNVIVWSNEATRFFGLITAKGGSLGGNGGFVETSGKNYLDASGLVNTSATFGKGGTWLLDPRNVIIQAVASGAATGTANEPNFTAVSDSAVVTTESIVTALNGGTSVSVSTGSSGLQSGDITIKNDILKTTGADATLTLSAANSIVVNSGVTISSSSNKLNLDFNADSDNVYGGRIELLSGSRLLTNGGNIDLYGGNTGKTGGYASSVDPAKAGLLLDGGVTLNTAATGITGGNINLRGSNSGSYKGIWLNGSGNNLLSGGGNISFAATGQGFTEGIEPLSVTDTNALISAGDGTVTLAADSMALAGKIGQAGDSGNLVILPLTRTNTIIVGGNKVETAGTLSLPGTVFSNVIDPSIATITIGLANPSNYTGQAGTVTMNNATFRNNVVINAPGTSASPATTGSIAINGTVDATGYNLTLNSYQGATVASGSGVTAGGLRLIDPRNAAIYDFSLGTNSVGTLAAHAGRLIYAGTGSTTIGTIDGTTGLTLTGTSASSITLTGGSADLTVNSAIASTGASAPLTLSAGRNVSVNAATISTNNGNMDITAASGLTATGAATLATGTGSLTLTADTMSFDSVSRASGTGSLFLKTYSAGRAINIGAGGGDDNRLKLTGALFAGTPVFQNGFSDITIGRTDGSGIMTIDGGLAFNAPVTLQSPSGGQVVLSATGNLDHSATNKNITIKSGTFVTAAGGILNSGSADLLVETGALTAPGASISGTGTLTIQPQAAGAAIHLGSGSSGLILPKAAFGNDGDTVFKAGYSLLTIGRADGTGAMDVSTTGIAFVDKTLLRSPLAGGTLAINGPITNTTNNTTFHFGTNGTQTVDGVITSSGLELLGRTTAGTPEATSGPVTKYDFLTTAAPNRISLVAANNVNQVQINNVTDMAVGTVNTTSGIQATRLYTAAGATSSVDLVKLQISAEHGKLTADNAPIRSTGSGDITLTADQMEFTGTALVAGSGNLLLQPFTATRNIDIGTYTAGTSKLQLAGSLFNGNVIKDGFYSVTIGQGGNTGSSGIISLAGDATFVDGTTIQSPNTTLAGAIVLDKTANIRTTGSVNTSSNSLTLIAKSISADTSDPANQALIDATTGTGTVSLIGDSISLGDGITSGARVNGASGRTLYLRPFTSTTNIDLGAGYAVNAANLQFGNDQFNDAANKIYSGFSSYVIGGRTTPTINVTGTAYFAGSLALEAGTLNVASGGTIDPIGSVRLQANAMNFGDLAHVTGASSLQLHPYNASYGLVVGDTSSSDPASNLLIPNSYFNGSGRTGTDGLGGTARVFTGNYSSTLTFGSTSTAQSVTMKNAVFPTTPNTPDNISLQAVADGTVDITGAINFDKNISVQAGTITTNPGASLVSASGNITLAGSVFNLNSSTGSISGVNNLYIRPYSYGGNVGLVSDAAVYSGGLALRQNMFNSVTGGSSGAINNTFSKITVGYGDYGSGTITVNNIGLDNHLDILAYNSGSSGTISMLGNLTLAADKTLVFKASGGATQDAASVITATKLALLGGSSVNQAVNYTLAGQNKVDILAADAGAVTFNNASALTIGSVAGTLDGTINGINAAYRKNTADVVKSSGAISVSTTGAYNLTVSQPVTSVNGLNTAVNLQSGGTLVTSGATAVISTTGTAPSGDIVLTADTMTFDAASRVTGTGNLTIRPLNLDTTVGIGHGSVNTLKLAGSLFSGTPVVTDGFSAINLGRSDGTGTVTVDGSVTFNDPVVIQSAGTGGTVSLGDGTAGIINNSATNQPVTLKADSILTKTGSLLNTGSGTVTLIANAMNFSGGGSITGTGTLALQAPDTTTRIALGTHVGAVPDAGGGLIINSADFNTVASSTFNNTTVGRSDGANPIVVNDFTSPTKLILQTPATNGIITVSGTLNMQNKDLTLTAAGNITGTAGPATNVANLAATSTAGAVTLTNTDNTITNLGAISAQGDVSIYSNNSASLNSAATGLNVASTVASTAGSVTIRTQGNLTLGSGAAVTTTSATKDIYLSAEGTYAHFFNNSTSGANVLNAGSGRWLVYSYSPSADNSLSTPGATATTDISGGLVKDYRYFNHTYTGKPPGTVSAPSYMPTAKRAFLYAFAPLLTVTLGERTYGYGNNTIVYTFGGLLGDDASNASLKTSITNSITASNLMSTTKTEASDAGLYVGVNGITSTGQINTDSGYYVANGATSDLRINPRSITVTANAISKIYDGTADAPAGWNPAIDYTLTSGSFYTADSAASVIVNNLALLGTYVNAGSYLTSAGKGVGAGTLASNTGNYTLTVVPGNYTIYKKPITVTGITADNKVYDGTTTATLNTAGATLSGVVAADALLVTLNTATASGAFVNKNVGDGKVVYVSGLGMTGAAGDLTNYSLTNASTYTTTANITRRPVGVTANSLVKTYGAVDPAMTYTTGTIDGLTPSGLVSGESLTGVLSRAAGEPVAAYAINQNTITDANNPNYAITYTGANLTINKAPLTVTAVNQTKVYGDTFRTLDLSSDYTITGYKFGEVLGTSGVGGTPTLSSTVGQYTDVNFSSGSVVPYTGAITVDTTPLSATNYSFTGVAGNFTVSKRPLTVTPSNTGKTYGDNDPSLAYASTSPAPNQSISGSLIRAVGENTGNYAFQMTNIHVIDDGTSADKTANYTISSAAANFNIAKRLITVTAATDTKTYDGTTTSINVPTITSGTLANNAGLGMADTITLSQLFASANAGIRNLNPTALVKTAGNVNNMSNYTVTLTSTPGTITQRPLSITSNNINRYYGDSNPAFTYTLQPTSTGVGLVAGETITDVAISASTALSNTSNAELTATLTPTGQTFGTGNAANYSFTYNPGTLTIDRRPVTVTATGGLTKVYGENNPGSYPYTAPTGTNGSGSGRVNGDVLTGALTRASGENVGNYAIGQGGVTNANNANYAITYVGDTFGITPRPITITAATNTKTYDGTLTASATPTITAGSLANNPGIGIVDAATMTETYTNKDAGTGKTLVPAATIANTSAGNSDTYGNYLVTFVNNLTGVINKRPVTVTGADSSKIYGDANPVVTGFTVAPAGAGTGLVGTETIDSVANTLYIDGTHTTQVVLGTNVGVYKVTPSASVFGGGGNSNNYTVAYTDGNFTINPATLTYVANPASRQVGTPNPAFSGTLTGFKLTDTLATATTGTAAFDSTANLSTPPGKYAINGSGLTANHGNYTFVQDSGNATALTLTGLTKPAEESVDNAKNPPTQPPVGGNPPNPPPPGGNPGPTINVTGTVDVSGGGTPGGTYTTSTGSNGTVTVFTDSTGNTGRSLLGDLGPRKAGTGVPVFWTDGVSGGTRTPEGLYNVSYSGSSLTLIPTPQTPPPPQFSEMSSGNSTTFQININGGGAASFTVTASNGVLTVLANDGPGTALLQGNDKAATRTLIATTMLKAVQELGVLPDQIQALFIQRQ